MAGFGVPPHDEVRRILLRILAGRNRSADENATLSRSNKREELGGALLSRPERMQAIIVQFQGGDPASQTVRGKDPVA